MTASDLEGEADGRSKVKGTIGGSSMLSSMLSSTPLAGLCGWMGERVAPMHE